MESKDLSENEKLVKEIAEYKSKIKELKKGYDKTIHQFSAGNHFF